MRLSRRALLAAAAAPALRAASPSNWPQFRGADSRGLSEDDPRLPESWSRTENVRWRTPLDGKGWGSPIVWDGTVFLTAAISEVPEEPLKKGLYGGGNRPEPPGAMHRWLARAYDLDSGELRWEKLAHRGVPKTSRHLKNSFASETPASDGKRFFAHFGHLGTFCYDFDGELVWSKTWPPYATRYGWGTSASPIVHDGRLYLVNDNEEQSYLLALEAATGREIWRVERDEKSNWATPYVWENAERTEIVVPGYNKTRSYDLDGKLLWELGPNSSIVIPTPFESRGLLYVASGYVGDETRPVYVIRPGATGDISLGPGETSNGAIVWSLPQGAPYNPSPIVYGDYYYTLYDRGFLTCHEAATGREVYGKQRIEVGATAFTASPWAYNGKLFALSEDGDCYVFEAGAEYKLLGKNSLGELCMATPAIVDGGLILRTGAALYRIARS